MKKIRLRLIIAPLFIAAFSQAQPSWPEGPMLVNAKISSSGELLVTPSKNSSQHDFEFLEGKWLMKYKKLTERLKNSNDWIEFESAYENFGMMLNGLGNTDFSKTILDNKVSEGFTLRLFNPQTRLWSLYFVASSRGVLDPPVVGSFEGDIGRFYGKDMYNGKPILVMFVWDKSSPEEPKWHQAFSRDAGKTWEWNWTNTKYRIKQ